MKPSTATDAPDTTDVADPLVGTRRTPAALVLLGLIAMYRWTAAIRTPRCRFYPSCSSYAVQAVTTHGAVRGAGLAARRLGRCHPWNPGGVDHVPPRK